MSADERKDEGAEERQSTPREGRENYCTSEDCRWYAWRLYCEGQFAFRPLSRGVNQQYHKDHPNCPEGPHDLHWAERAIDFCGAATAESINRGGPAQMAKLLAGLQSDIQAQLALATGGTSTIKVKRRDKDGRDYEETFEIPDNFLRSLARSRATDARMHQGKVLRIVKDTFVHETDPNNPPHSLIEILGFDRVVEIARNGRGRNGGDADGGSGVGAARE